jgi:glutathione peroxidase
MKLYNHSILSIDGKEVSLEEYENKTVIVVNTASKCGFTPQYEGLEKIHKENENVVVIGFPCNQFGGQEPGPEQEIKEFCSTKYDVTFLMSSRIDVNGEGTHPLYVWLKERAGVDEISWNFCKFVVSPKSETVTFYNPGVEPQDIKL